MNEFDNDAVRIGVDLCRGHPALNDATERCEMGLKNSLGFVLWQAALELAATANAIVTHGAELGHVWPVHASTMNMLGRINEWRQ